jgi:ribosomal protein L3 glutamine methyltransferase
LATIEDYIRWGATRMQAAGICCGHGTDNTLDEASALVLSALALGPEHAADLGARRVTREQRQAIESLLERRVVERLPLPYLIGEAWFAGLRFQVDRRVLIPRSPIAELIEEGFSIWLGDRQSPRILDLCTGAACIAVATACYLPDAQIDAVDLSDDALAVARKNVRDHNVESRVRLIRSDLFSGLSACRYDLIVSNPPYVGREEMAALPIEYGHEPEMALSSGEDGLDIPLRILDDAGDYLTPGGALIMEVGNSDQLLAECLPEIPFFWLEFERGGHGVLALTAAELASARPAVQALLKERRQCR